MEVKISKSLANLLPSHYGWFVLFAVCCAGFARQGPAVATLSIFVTPMTIELEWSRTIISGAVSLGGILAALTSPFIGTIVDKRGARFVLCLAISTTAICSILISFTESVLAFYLLFCIARMNFAGPFDLGIYSAINNWFVRLRPQAVSIATLVQMVGLTAMPLIAYAAISFDGWRMGWIIIGATVFVIGFFPNFFLLHRSPEDIGLSPDGGPIKDSSKNEKKQVKEPIFSRAEAMKTSAFWFLIIFTALVYPIQAGISLHQAPHLIERGLSAGTATLIVSTFSVISGASALLYGFAVRRFGARINLFVSAIFLTLGCILMNKVQESGLGYLAAIFFGLGIGGVLCVLPIIWADYYGRTNFGAIRGVVLTVQVGAQAIGPILSGALRDWTYNYDLSLLTFSFMAILSACICPFIRPPSY